MKTLIPIFILLFFAGGCKKALISSGWTYSIKGKMLQDCNGTPIANYDLQLKYKSAGPLDEPSKILGTTTTDAQGNFTISGIPIEYLNSLYLQHVVNANDVDNWWYSGSVKRPANDNEVVDLGTFYGEYELNSVVKLDIDNTKFGTNDTLYVGNLGDFRALYPIPTTTILTFSKSQMNSLVWFYEKGLGLQWGIGKAYYNSLNTPNPPSDWELHRFFAKQTLCGYGDTTYYKIQ